MVEFDNGKYMMAYTRDIKIYLNDDCDDNKFLDDFVDMIEKNELYCGGVLKNHMLDFTIEFGKILEAEQKWLKITEWLKKHQGVIIFEFDSWELIEEND